MIESLKKFLKMEAFLKEYCPGVLNIKHKLRGIDGNKKPIAFTDADKIVIRKGLQKFAKDILKE